jgi:hypothetical protein
MAFKASAQQDGKAKMALKDDLATKLQAAEERIKELLVRPSLYFQFRSSKFAA